MDDVLASAHSVLPFGVVLASIFQQFDTNLDDETNIRMCKPFDTIDNSCISHLGYELHKNEWVLKTTRVPTTDEETSDEEAVMDMLTFLGVQS